MSTWVYERVEHITVNEIGKNYLEFTKRFVAIRPDKPCCEFCQTNFQFGDMMHIAFTDKGNKFICDPCLAIGESNGVSVTDREEFYPNKGGR